MKKCPSCERTFEDNMRFCQSDGTALVDDAPPVDPYKTMVASSEEIKAAMPAAPAADPPKQDDEVLQLPPEADPKKTMYASEDEIRKEMDAHEPVMDLPPLAPEPPKFTEPSLSPPSFGGAPPPSPFSPSANEPIANPTQESPFSKTTPPIPSPFNNPKSTTYEPPPSPNFSALSDPEAADISAPAPFEPTPPVEASASAPIQNWEPKPMQNAPVSGPQGQNKTLAIVSLVAGILGVTICCGTIVPSLVAIITGFMARGKASSDPSAYGGGGLALGGLITGVLGLLGGIAYLIFIFFFGGMQLLMQGAR
ncbi:MAG: DUF4190 domain-containing protein [Acidobacteria bacterium]|nr:DUF4190 domain-containing protein [Acidobacteriota bacterium]